MNSEAAAAEKERSGRGERRYLSLGREDSMQVPGDESWLDELEDESTMNVDEDDGKSLVGSILAEWEEACTVLGFDGDTTTTSVSTIKPKRHASVPMMDEDATAGASQRSSSTWDESEKFWASNTPPPPGFSNNLRNHYSTQVLSTSSNPLLKHSKKRDFEVEKDTSPKQEEDPATNSHSKKKKYSNDMGQSTLGSRYRKSSGPSDGTPKATIQKTGSSSQLVGNVSWTPGNFYDAQGFLKF
jgi:hypothetical protein